MKYIFETEYNQKSLSVMAKCVRKTVRRKRSRRSHIAGWVLVVLAVVLFFDGGGSKLSRTVTLAVAAILAVTLVFEDSINGYFAGKRMLKGTEKSTAVFDKENKDTFVSQTEAGKSEFNYNKILLVAETDRYFVFLLSRNHAQLYDKNSLEGGTAEEFRDFITEATGNRIVPVPA